MQRIVAVAIVLFSPVALAVESTTAFWHWSAHGDSIVLIVLGAWIVRRQCLKAMYPEHPTTPPRKRGLRLSGARSPVQNMPAWFAQYAAIQLWVRNHFRHYLR